MAFAIIASSVPSKSALFWINLGYLSFTMLSMPTFPVAMIHHSSMAFLILSAMRGFISENNYWLFMRPELIAPCGMNCAICLAYFGYQMNGKRRKSPCPGCRPAKKNCAFIIKRCKYLPKKEVEFCSECKDFPCDNLRKLDERYRTRFSMSMIENLNFIKKNGMDEFLRQQTERYRCQKCGGTICVHDGKCYSCEIE